MFIALNHTERCPCASMCILPHQCPVLTEIVMILVYFFKKEIVLYILFLKYYFYFEVTFCWTDELQRYHRKVFYTLYSGSLMLNSYMTAEYL